MMIKQVKSEPILPVSYQCFYFVLIALLYFMGLDAFSISFTAILPFSVAKERIFFSYFGVLFLLFSVFYAHHLRQLYGTFKPAFWMLGLIALMALSILLLNDRHPNFIIINFLMTAGSYLWVALFITAYFGVDPKINQRTLALTLVIGPLMVAALFLLLNFSTKLLITQLDLNLYSWPLWFRCFMASLAILVASHLIIGMNHWLFHKKALYQYILILGFILSAVAFIYVNVDPVFEHYFMMLEFDFPAFIK